MDLITLDYAGLSPREKRRLINHMASALDETMGGCSFTTQILAQLLFVQRFYQFHRQAGERLSLTMPRLLPDMAEILWRCLLGKASLEELADFYRRSDPVVTDMCVGGGPGPEADAEFWARYRPGWNHAAAVHFYMGLAAWLNYLQYQIVTGARGWFVLTDGETLAAAADIIDGCGLESVFRRENGVYTARELDMHLSELYQTPAFAGIFARLQKDLNRAKGLGPEPSKRALLELYGEYREAPLFLPGDMDRIISAYRSRYIRYMEAGYGNQEN